MARRASLQGSQAAPPLTSRNISQGLALLTNLDQQRQPREHDTQPYARKNPMKTLTPQAQSTMPSSTTKDLMHWNTGSGRKSEVTGRDLLLMMLTSLKHCGSWDIVAAVFKQKSATFQKRVLIYIGFLHPFFMRKYVAVPAEKWTMSQLAANGDRFTNYPYARYATDVTFQQTNVPAGSYAEKKSYGHKVEVSVLLNGLAINCTKHYKGSVADKSIFDDNLEFHANGLAKQGDDGRLDDPERVGGARQWAVLVDKGYQGIQRE
ncbi:hypothetical protein H257_19163, partial [Aphanomyces astaci]